MTLKTTKPKPDLARAEAAIAELAAGYPEVTEEAPWGHRAFKVRRKVFLFLGADGEGLSLSVKLPTSGRRALELSFTEPTHYGLGKSGWVTARVTSARDLPLSLVAEWLRESFHAIAPKQLANAFSAAEDGAKRPAKRVAAKRPAKRVAAKRPSAKRTAPLSSKRARK